MNKSLIVDHLTVEVSPSEQQLAPVVAQQTGEYLKQVLQQRGEANIVFATGSSQLGFLGALTALEGLDWSKITCFHLDEYLGLSATHPASFRYYLQEQILAKVQPAQFYTIRGDADEPLLECDRYTQLLKTRTLDLCCLGIGENGHLAFNEPHVADFYDPYLIKLVKLDPINRQQQVNQGHFPSLDQVPQYAYTLTIPVITAAQKILGFAFGDRKAKIIKTLLSHPVTPNCPASILRHHPQATLYLDPEAAGLIVES
ncbi:glucosamine-6-phosphate deaminase, partial [Spirulina sp. CS-785/01]|uniref:glucosamine-6-phosphate deaminase n=1 Tax=Spirulina sp. CS-785/01 TaxID=3021716 RepID=UPI00232E0A6A